MKEMRRHKGREKAKENIQLDEKDTIFFEVIIERKTKEKRKES